MLQSRVSLEIKLGEPHDLLYGGREVTTPWYGEPHGGAPHDPK